MGNSMITNQMFIDGIRKGDEKTLKMFYKKNYWMIRAYVIQNSGNLQDAEDVFQDALVFLYKKLQSNSLVIDTTIHAYFYGVCKNLWRNKLRRKKKIIFTDSLKKYHHYSECEIISDITHNDQELLYQKYFLELTDPSKQVLSLYFEGKSMKEIALLTGYSEGYVRKKKFESKQKLLQKMKQDKIYIELHNTKSMHSNLLRKKAI